MSRHRPQPVVTLEMDATIIESHRKEALPHYKGGRGYQPSLVYWVEQALVVADQFRDGNVPAGKAPLDVVKRAFAALPASVEHRRFRADSAAYEDTMLKWLANKANRIERFTVSADMTPPLRKLAERVASSEWKVYAPGFARAQALGPGRPESVGTRRFAAWPGATARRRGGLNVQIVLVSGPHGRPTALACQSTASI